MSRLDVATSLLLDIYPRFQVPKELVPTPNLGQLSSRLTASMQTWNDKFPSLTDISTALASVANFSTEVNAASQSPRFWKDELFIGVRLNPIAHQLLMIPRFSFSEEAAVGPRDGLVIREAIRLTSLLILGLLRKRFHAKPDGISMHAQRLAQLLKAHSLDWHPFADIYLWILVVSAAVQVDRRDLVTRIVGVMSDIGIDSWRDAILVIKDIAWVDETAAMEIGIIGDEVSSKLQNGLQGSHNG
jgi:hypothetical protein